MTEFDRLKKKLSELSVEIRQTRERLQQVCDHVWVWSQVAGDGQYCPKCGAHNYDCND